MPADTASDVTSTNCGLTVTNSTEINSMQRNLNNTVVNDNQGVVDLPPPLLSTPVRCGSQVGSVSACRSGTAMLVRH